MSSSSRTRRVVQKLTEALARSDFSELSPDVSAESFKAHLTSFLKDHIRAPHTDGLETSFMDCAHFAAKYGLLAGVHFDMVIKWGQLRPLVRTIGALKAFNGYADASVEWPRLIHDGDEWTEPAFKITDGQRQLNFFHKRVRKSNGAKADGPLAAYCVYRINDEANVAFKYIWEIKAVKNEYWQSDLRGMLMKSILLEADRRIYTRDNFAEVVASGLDFRAD